MIGIGERIKEIREKQGMTCTALAKSAGLSAQGLWNLENGSVGRTFEKLPFIAKALGCRIDDLFPEMDEVREDGNPARADGIEKEKAAGQAAEDSGQDDDEWGGFDFT
ncbi:MAG: helix-turn-helix transcriptional regulator [Clostridia bacterium]|nr:helix-turn-helix transcriptional regulator [Clostridia bacterium]